jgi:hypothetical protein
MLYRNIKFADKNKTKNNNEKLMLDPWDECQWNIKRYYDSYYAKESDTRRTVIGYAI